MTVSAYEMDLSTGHEHPVYQRGDGSWHRKRGCAPPGASAVELTDVLGDADPCGNCVADRNGDLPERVHGVLIEP